MEADGTICSDGHTQARTHTPTAGQHQQVNTLNLSCAAAGSEDESVRGEPGGGGAAAAACEVAEAACEPEGGRCLAK